MSFLEGIGRLTDFIYPLKLTASFGDFPKIHITSVGFTLQPFPFFHSVAYVFLDRAFRLYLQVYAAFGLSKYGFCTDIPPEVFVFLWLRERSSFL